MNSILLSIAAILIIAFSALFAVPYVIDWNTYKTEIEAQASAVLGRKVDIAGDVNLRMFPTPYIKLTDLQVSEPSETGTPILQARSFTMWLSLPPLLQGIFQAREMEISDSHFQLIIDENGRGNWELRTSENNNLAFIPKEISLEKVNIKNAKFDVYQADSLTPFTLQSVNGTLSAGTLKGPYKFTGFFMYEGVRRDLRLSTGRQGPNGSMRLKSTVNILSSGNSMSFDGQLNTRDKVELTGVFTSLFRPPAEKSDRLDKDPATGKIVDNSAPRTVEIKSALTANLNRAVFKDLVVSFAGQSQPQLLTGEAVAEWNQGLNLKSQLTARWLDLDQILSGKSSKLEIKQLLSLFSTYLRDSATILTRAAVQAKIEQANIGGDQVHSIDLQISKDKEKFELVKFTAQMPGQNNVNLSGQLKASQQGLGFSGLAALDGRNFSRLLNWISPEWNKSGKSRPVDYLMRGQLTLSPDHLQLDDFQGELGQSAFSGAFLSRLKNKREFALTLDSEKIDLESIFGDQASIKSLRDLIWSSGSPSRKQENSDSNSGIMSWLSNQKSRINLRIGHILLPSFQARDLLVDVSASENTLNIKALNFVSDDGLTIRTDGNIVQLDKKPSGTVQLEIDAPSTEELKTLAELIDLPAVYTANENRLRSITPLRMAVTLRSNPDSSEGADLRFDGALADSQLSLAIKLAEGLKDPANQRIELFGTMRSSNGRGLLRQLATSATEADKKGTDEAGSSTEGFLQIRSTGIANKGLETVLQLNAGGVQGAFDGKVHPNDDNPSVEGIVRIKAQDSSDALMLVGLDEQFKDARQPLFVESRLKVAGGIYSFSNLKGTMGKSIMSAEGMVDSSKSPILIKFKASASNATLSSLLGFMVQKPRSAAVENLETEGAGGQTYWSNKPFDNDLFETIDAEVALKTDELKFGEDIALKNANLSASIKDGVFQVTDLSGELFEGSMKTSLDLKKSRAGYVLNGQTKLTSTKLSAINNSRSGDMLASGKAGALISFRGEGLSPRGLVSVLKGSGKLSVSKGQIYRLSPEAIENVVQANIVKKSTGSIDAELAKEFKRDNYPFRAFRARILIEDGNIKLDDVTLKSGKTTADIKTIFEIPTLRIDSEWTLTSRMKGRKKDLPPVKVSFAGPLEAVGAITPVIETKVLERFLTVSKMERDMEKLEKLEMQGRQSLQKLPPKDLPPEQGSSNTNIKKKPATIPRTSAGGATGAIPEDSVVKSELPPLPQHKPSTAPDQGTTTITLPDPAQQDALTPGAAGTTQSPQGDPDFQTTVDETQTVSDPEAQIAEELQKQKQAKKKRRRKDSEVHPFYQNF